MDNDTDDVSISAPEKADPELVDLGDVSRETKGFIWGYNIDPGGGRKTIF